MEMTGENIVQISSHKSRIIHSGVFPKNDDNHIFTLSQDGNIREFLLDTGELIFDSLMQRPDDGLLTKNDHQLHRKSFKVKVHQKPDSNKETSKFATEDRNNFESKSQNTKHRECSVFTNVTRTIDTDISKTLLYKNSSDEAYLALGYEDGLIDIWTVIYDLSENYIIENQLDDFPKENENFLEGENVLQSELGDGEVGLKLKDLDNDINQSIHSEIKSNQTKKEPLSNNKTPGKSILKVNQEINQSENLDDTMKISNKPLIRKPYVNIFKLSLILIGHSSFISSLHYYNNNSQNLLISSCSDNTVKIWDLDKGIPIYNFNTDIRFHCSISSKSGKEETVSLLSNSSHRLELRLSKNPISFSTLKVNFNNISCIKAVPNANFPGNYMLGTDKGRVLVLDERFNLLGELYDYSFSEILFIEFWSQYLLTVNSKRRLSVNTVAMDKQAVNVIFSIEICKMDLTSLCLLGDQTLIGSDDGNAYLVDLSREMRLFSTRTRMREEDKLSIQYNLFLRANAGKKKKKRATSANKNKTVKKLPSTGLKTKKKPGK